MRAISRLLVVIVVTVVVALMVGPSSAADVPVHVINDKETTQTIACDAKDTIMVNGGDNTLTVDAAAEIAVNGAGNKVTYKSGAAGKPAPRLSNLGKGNSIV